MPTVTDTEILENIRDAIVKVLLGQQYTILGRVMQRANLGELRKMEREYQRRVNGSMRNRASIRYA